MDTSLFNSIIFGPIKSRRLGVSLGVNLPPAQGKLCNFDCVYCECGMNAERRTRQRIPSREEVRTALEQQLEAMCSRGDLLDVITFAGNGEPTLHPHFPVIIDDTIALRNRYYPSAAISVLSNATQLHRPEVVSALMRIENNIQKIDAGRNETMRLIDKPTSPLHCIERVAEQCRQFDGEVIIQTLFLRGTIDGAAVDNSTDEEVQAWLEVVAAIAPRSVMIYTIDRPTPLDTLQKVPLDRLNAIAALVHRLGIKTSVAG